MILVCKTGDKRGDEAQFVILSRLLSRQSLSLQGGLQWLSGYLSYFTRRLFGGCPGGGWFYQIPVRDLLTGFADPGQHSAD